MLSRGLLGSDGEVTYVASPMYKDRFDLASGACLDGVSPGVRVWPVRVWGSTVEVLATTGTPAPEEIAATAEPVTTHCPYCALQCGMRLRVLEPADSAGSEPAEPLEPAKSVGPESLEPAVKVLADPDFPVNRGRMCVKG